MHQTLSIKRRRIVSPDRKVKPEFVKGMNDREVGGKAEIFGHEAIAIRVVAGAWSDETIFAPQELPIGGPRIDLWRSASPKSHIRSV